jgi:hypothetical protein
MENITIPFRNRSDEDRLQKFNELMQNMINLMEAGRSEDDIMLFMASQMESDDTAI